MFRKNTLLLVVMTFFVFVVLGGCSKKQTVAPPEPVVDTTPVEPEPVVEEVEPVDTEVETTPMRPVLNDVFFDFDKFVLKDNARRTLEANAKQLKNATSYSVTIEGHCDERGTNAYNLALGEKRAKATKDYLVSLGVSAGRIKTVSYGEERPFERGGTEAAWAKNRRSHFLVN